MRIAYLCRSLPLHRDGGLEWHAWDLALGLARSGHTLRILTTPFQPPEKHSRLATQMKEKGIELHPVGTERGGRYSAAYFREACARVAEWARAGEIDLVHSQGFGALFLSRSAVGKVPLVVTVHGTWWSETLLDRRARDHFPGWEQLRWLWRYRHRVVLSPLYRRLLQSADVLTADSEFTKGELIRESPGVAPKVRVVPLGVDLQRFPFVCEERADSGGYPVRLLMLGRLERAKGFDVALRALAACRNRNWLLRIGGDGPERTRLEQLCAELELPVDANDADSKEWSAPWPVPRVEFPGRVPDGMVAREFASADLFLNPDLTQPAFGLVALESMLQATPVLASRVGAMPEVLGDAGGWLVAPANVQAWRRAIDERVADPAALREAGARARHSALRRFSLDRMVDGVARVYDEAAAVMRCQP